jgi:hypothetical protein
MPNVLIHPYNCSKPKIGNSAKQIIVIVIVVSSGVIKKLIKQIVSKIY